MKKVSILIFIIILLFSCKKEYRIINIEDLNKLTIQDTLLNHDNFTVVTIGKSKRDKYPKLLVKKNKLYVFERDFEVQNDSLIISYEPAFIIDSSGAFRKNGIWIYATFYNEGVFPFISKNIKFSVDSIPNNWKGKPPKSEGIYLYQNNKLVVHSKEQSEKRFKEKEINGFYFIPNKGRLFNKTNINKLD